MTLKLAAETSIAKSRLSVLYGTNLLR